MGLSIKKIHGKEFLYYQEHGKSLLIGPKGEYEKGSRKNVTYAINHIDSRIAKILEKYVEEAIELSLYLPEAERRGYLCNKYAELLSRLGRLNSQKK